MIDDPNEELRNHLLAAIASKKRNEVEKAVNDFEIKADKSKILPDDKQLLDRIKKLLQKPKTFGGRRIFYLKICLWIILLIL